MEMPEPMGKLDTVAVNGPEHAAAAMNVLPTTPRH